jgi:hypothetical protein
MHLFGFIMGTSYMSGVVYVHFVYVWGVGIASVVGLEHTSNLFDVSLVLRMCL